MLFKNDHFGPKKTIVPSLRDSIPPVCKIATNIPSLRDWLIIGWHHSMNTKLKCRLVEMLVSSVPQKAFSVSLYYTIPNGFNTHCLCRCYQYAIAPRLVENNWGLSKNGESNFPNKRMP